MADEVRRIVVGERELDRRAGRQEIVLSRRSLVKGALGLGVAAGVGAMLDPRAEAARRGYSGPKIPESSAGSGGSWWVEISANWQGNALEYRIRQAVSGDPFMVFFGNQTLPPLYIDIDDRRGEIFATSGYSLYTFQTPGIHTFRAWQQPGTFGGLIGPWAELNITG